MSEPLAAAPVADSQQPPPLANPAANPTAVTPSGPAAAPAVKSFLEQAQELGFTNLESEADAQARLIEAYRQEREAAQAAQRRAQELEELARYREQVALQAQQAQQQQQAPPPAVSPAAAAADPYSAPYVDLAAVQFFRNDDGSWKPETPAEVKQQVARYDAYRKQWSAQLLDKPKEALSPLVKEIVAQQLAEAQAKLQATTEEEAAKQRFIAASDWLYLKDPVTQQPKRDPITGNFQFSPEGVKFGEYMHAAEAAGITSLSGQLQYAQTLRELDQLRAAQGQQAAAQQSQQTNAQLKQDLLARATQVPQRSGTFPKPGDPPARTQNKHLSLGERTLALMQANGHS